MKRILLTGLSILALLIALAMGWLLNSEAGLRWAYRQAEALLPGALHTQQLSGSLSAGVILRGVAYEDAGVRLTADGVYLHWNPWALLSARIDISRLALEQLEVELSQTEGDSGNDLGKTGLPRLELPLTLQLQALEIDSFRFGQGGTPVTLEQLQLRAQGRGSALEIDAFSVRIVEVAIGENQVNDFEIKLAGEIDVSANYAHSLGIDWQTRSPAGEIIFNSAHMEGDLASTRLTHQSSGPLQAKLTLSLRDVVDNLSWQGRLEVASFDTTRLDSTLPVLRGSLDASAKGDLSGAQASGTVDADSAQLGAFKSSFELHSLDASQMLDGVQIESLQVAIFGGNIGAQGKIYWAPTLAWESELNADKIDPARLAPDWPGSLGGRLQSRGQVDGDKLVANANISELSGRLRGYPVSLKGEVEWRDDTLDIRSARLDSGNTQISANGRVAGDIDLEWSFDSRDLAEIYPSARGQLIADGHLGGETDAPVVEARFEGKSIRLDDYAVGSIDGDIVVDLLNWRQLDLHFAAREVELQDQRLDSIDVAADQRRIKAGLVTAIASAELVAEGELHEQGWRGKLLSADIDSTEFDSWRLRQPAVLSLSRDSLSSEPLCLQSSQQSQICASTQRLDDNWDINLGLTRVPLRMLRRWTPQDLELDGVVDASANLQYNPARPLLGKLSARFPAAAARYALQQGQLQSFDYQVGGLELLLEADQLEATARLALENGDRIEASTVLPGADLLRLDLERQTMRTAVKMNVRNWSFVDTLLPRIRILRGEMELQIDASGAISQPRLQFDGRFSDGAIHLLEPDLKLQHIELDLNSTSAENLEYSVELMAASGRIAVQGSTQMQHGNSWPSKLRFDVEGLDLGSLASIWSGPNLDIDGNLQARGELELELDENGILGQPAVQLDARLDGGVVHLLEPELRFEQFSLEVRSNGPQRFAFDGEATSAGGRIALSGNTLLQPDRGWPSTISFHGDGIDLASALGPWIAAPLAVDGKLRAEGEFNYRAPDHLLGQVRLSSASGRLEYPLLEQEVEAWEYQDALVVLKLDESGIDASSSIEVGDSSDLAAELRLPQARALAFDFENQALQASTRIDFEELNLVQLLFPEIDRLEGAVSLDIAVDGSLAQPRVSAKAKLPLGSFRIPRLGLQVEQLSLLGESDDSNRFNFRMSASSGEGQLSIHGSSQLESKNHWTANLQVRGADFEVSRIPEAHVLVSPDLQISVEGRNVKVEGDLLIPYARLEPKDISTATKVSNDTVVIGGGDPDAERWQISTRVNLILGDEVSLSGFGFEGNFGGRLLVEDRPGELSTGNGEITILDGRYRAYGQNLEIDKGRVLFGGGALDNPGLDLRAQREVNDVTVGLTITGRLRDPQIELFSIPAMGETDTLSYLLFGHPMDTASASEESAMASAAMALGLAGTEFLAQGLGENFGIDDIRVESSDSGDQASLVVGRYLSPKMYVSYGVGLVESLNLLTLRYQLADRWHLEAESGYNTQGVDLLFTIER